jgi:hypothetical protein
MLKTVSYSSNVSVFVFEKSEITIDLNLILSKKILFAGVCPLVFLYKQYSIETAQQKK